MKQFSQFITEARTTKASQEAKRLGLVGDGHGDWYDRQGNLKAKTVKGELKLFSGGKGGKGKLGTPGAKASAISAKGGSSDLGAKLGSKFASTAQKTTPNPASANGQAKASLQQVSRENPLTIAFDKFDDEDVTDNILSTVADVAAENYFYIFPSRDTQIEELKNAYPKISESIVDDENAETIYDVLQSLYENGFDAINIIVRQSRAKEISELALKGNGEIYNFIMMNVIPVDERTVREQYLAGDIFKHGAMVESGNKIGQIFRRGANHLICVDENKEIFRAWISEAKEVDKLFLPLDF